MAMHDLRFRFDLELAQLFTQPRDRLFEFIDMEFERAHLLIQTRVIDTDLTRCIEQIFEQVRIDTRELLALVGGSQRTGVGRRFLLRRQVSRPVGNEAS